MEPSSAPWRVLETEQPAAVATATEPSTSRVPWPAIGVAILAAAVGVGAFLLAARSDPDVGVEGDVAAAFASADPWGATPPPGAGGPLLVVEVGGAVARPGVYSLPPGARVGDAIAAAGGYGTRVDAALADRQLNLAALVRDGDEIHVPSRDEREAGAPGGPDAGPGAGAGGLVDLNVASASELDTLPGIGPATAAKIIAAREEQRFASVDDLLARKVVGQATLEKIRDLVSVGP